ncbi:hypothetical protein B296_00040383 [Ensete ventricosum]|uniref:Uncharacterized protein n=1 Tax=Ensete ventricosum TaxID=4639 RepID=A0A426ZLZ9_ENSVE|nr:hypothetical protein B296_00040383 [Ensete ventricosum]
MITRLLAVVAPIAKVIAAILCFLHRCPVASRCPTASTESAVASSHQQAHFLLFVACCRYYPLLKSLSLATAFAVPCHPATT